MRHGKTFNHLGRTSTHRKAMLSNMASSLILEKRIVTTLAKAKALRSYVEPLLNRSKENTMHSRRTAFSYLQNKFSTKELFDVIGEKIGDRKGGYTRIIKLAPRLGDNASMCMMEIVDFNTTLIGGNAEGKAKNRTRRGRGGKKGGNDTPEVKPTETKENDAVVA
jgi:large subunit ribosomal protein L17